MAAVWPLRRLALARSLVDHPGPRKAHAAPIPYLGGAAVAAGMVGVGVLRPGLAPVLALAALVALLGLYDDLWHAPVAAKLVVEGAAALAAIMAGFSWHLTDSWALNAAFSLVWIIGLTNSFNLLDNMDGLSSTVAIVALAGLGLLAPAEAGLAFPLAACLLAFLVVNFPPARMFLGDAGSLPVGFLAGLLTIATADTARGLHSLVLLVLPVGLALFDTSLVIVSRLRAGLPIQLGGRDHFSHRLRLLGWSQRQVLAAAAVAAVATVAAAALGARYPDPVAWVAVPVAAVLVLAWFRVLAIDPYASQARPEVLSS